MQHMPRSSQSSGKEVHQQSDAIDLIANVFQVVTECQHTYCFECIYQWYGHSLACLDCCRGVPPGHSTQEEVTPADITPRAKRSNPQLISGHHKSKLSTDTNQPSIEGVVGGPVNSPVDSLFSKSSLPPPPPPSEPLPSSYCETQSTFQHRTLPLPRIAPRRGHERFPSCGSTAYKDDDYDPPQPDYSSYSRCTTPVSSQASSATEDKAAYEIYRHNGCQTPTTDHERESAASRAGALFVESEEMLARMYQASIVIAASTRVPLRCRAIAKCVWREWRNLLRLHDGQWILAEDLFDALSRSFEDTVVDYGWAQHWSELPQAFVEVLKETAEVITNTGLEHGLDWNLKGRIDVAASASCSC